MDPKAADQLTSGVRFRNFMCAAVMLSACVAGLGWYSDIGTVRVLAQSNTVPFRLLEASIREMQAAMQAGTVTSEDLVRMYLARIDAYDKRGPAINAVQYINPNALAQARALDLERRTKGARGPLHGIPILLKDNFDTFDMPTTASSLSLAGSVPPDDGYQVRRLREAGAVFLGKAAMSEFAWTITTISSAVGQTLNPYDLTRNPGGSSGGTGAAVAANFAAIGTGSDTCGSIRIPASHNSLVGIRATQGLFSLDGIIPLALSQDVGGPIGRSVEDVALVLDATAGYDPNDPATAVSPRNTPATYTHFLQTGRLRGGRFGLLTDALIVDPADREVADVIHAARGELVREGATVIDVSIPDYATISNFSLITREFKTHIEQYLANTPGAPLKTLQQIVDSGKFHPAVLALFTPALTFPSLNTDDYRQRVAARAVFKGAILKVLNDNNLDALIYPTIRQKPVLVPNTNQPGSNCRVSAHSGLPAISVPVGFTADGIPVGMEFLGREFTEGDLLRFGYSWEQATRHRRAPASTPAIQPHFGYVVSDGVAALQVDAPGRRVRFTGPGMDTDVYIDPSMQTTDSFIRGDLRDAHWHVRYAIPTGTSGVSTIQVEDLESGGGSYVLYGTAVPQ